MTADPRLALGTLDLVAPPEKTGPIIVTDRPKKWGYAPKDGHTWNPLAKWPVNEPCWCSSGKKAKKCCLPGAKKTLSVEAAQGFANLMGRGVYGRALIRQAFIENAKQLAKTQPEGMTIEGKVAPDAGG